MFAQQKLVSSFTNYAVSFGDAVSGFLNEDGHWQKFMLSAQRLCVTATYAFRFNCSLGAARPCAAEMLQDIRPQQLC